MGRLKGVPRILSPDLLHTIASMGHGDELVLCDANFPSSSISKHGPKLVDASGHGIPDLLAAIMKFFPLDTYVDSPALLMDLVPSDKAKGLQVPVWEAYKKILDSAHGADVNVSKIDRFDFYNRSQDAYALVATGETALYGNIIIKKGVIGGDD